MSIGYDIILFTRYFVSAYSLYVNIRQVQGLLRLYKSCVMT